MPKWFGTDGIRGIANQDPITPEMGEKLGHAVVQFCKRRGLSPSINIGRDTRASGKMLEEAIIKGINGAEGKAFCAGDIPTPAVACLNRIKEAGAGIVISASHNPHEYNGFKIFSGDGYKLSENEEDEIEELIKEAEDLDLEGSEGEFEYIKDASDIYISFLKKSISDDLGPADMRVVLDCSNGATSDPAPRLFKEIGLQVEALFNSPDGENINRNCGSQHTEALQKKVKETGADLGLAFDGDGDRLIAIDEKGEALTGDQLMAIYACMLQATGELKGELVVSTVMSNMGLKIALKEMGIEQFQADVGDRNVMEQMRLRNANLGGEDSGHIIFHDYHTTGDGMLSALQLIRAINLLKKPLSRLAALMTVLPQTLINVPVKKKPDIGTVPSLEKEIGIVNGLLEGRGRVLVRYSGTEPLCRIMVEGEDRKEIDEFASRIAKAVSCQLG